MPYFDKANFGNLISIGPGNALIELILQKKFNFNKILLIDIENSTSHHHGYSNLGSGYASLVDTKKFLIDNGIDKNQIIICNPNLQKIPNIKIDVLVSIISMGFHYPCDTYFEYIMRNSSKGSLIFLDKRKNIKDEGFEKLFNICNCYLVKEFKKNFRILLERK